MNGTLLCTKYAFPPNYFQYCGPDENKQLREYLQDQPANQRGRNEDPTPRKLLSEFGTLYSYLTAIAHANAIADPLDPRVVRAYWIGSPLLEQLDANQTFEELKNGQQLQMRLPQQYRKWLYPKVTQARLHHSFHVMNVFMRTGHVILPITVESMDNCRIGWGKIIKIHDDTLEILSQRIVLIEGKLQIRPKVIRTVQTPQPTAYQIGDIVSYHWNWVCDVISTADVKQLKYYTTLSMKLANCTL